MSKNLQLSLECQTFDMTIDVRQLVFVLPEEFTNFTKVGSSRSIFDSGWLGLFVPKGRLVPSDVHVPYLV